MPRRKGRAPASVVVDEEAYRLAALTTAGICCGLCRCACIAVQCMGFATRAIDISRPETIMLISALLPLTNSMASHY